VSLWCGMEGKVEDGVMHDLLLGMLDARIIADCGLMGAREGPRQAILDEDQGKENQVK
jgi:hypothetical protein